MTKVNFQRWQILLFSLSLVILASSFYFQYVQGLQPCPLCLMQRFCVFLLVIIGLLGMYSKQITKVRILAISQIIVAAAGLFFAGRQLWLQSLPMSQVPSCLPDLEVLLRYFPWRDVFHALFWGAGDCAEVNWEWLGLSMPAWSGLYFIFMFLTGVFFFWTLRRETSASDYSG
ncbi:disulfide bond formation protein DsbB [Legionella lansingensis]|uniref:Disulfide bond formation protein B n=1 Tax=Legionella lansingensis TaxID=45067 RepID=A0A0W0VPW1_9GAMM|nr:disulfide bond formation protein B [Legionella lansingensis]KTD22058.1 disulfide bond formation protein DsbB [Legionella lansingensis]SNV54187.1 disulfide bond formation protein DsbB [Legionella lansingensis]